MHTFVALLRGINVGGKNPLPMKKLVSCFEAIGARQVTTYIQSGNVVFQHTDGSKEKLTNKLCTQIETQCGFASTILIVAPQKLIKVIDENPFREGEADHKTLHVGFLTKIPTQPDLESLAKIKKDSERYLLKEDVFYLFAPEGVGKSKLAVKAEKLLGVAMTDRNWRTVCALRDILGALDEK